MFVAPVEAAAVVSMLKVFVAIDVVKPRAVDIAESPVIEEVAALPASAEEAGAGVTKPVVHATVIADVKAPVAAMPEVHAISETPISRSKEVTRLRRQHPGPRTQA